MKQRESKKGNARAERELHGTFWGIAAGVIVYLSLICAVKDISFVLVGVAAAAVILSAAAVAVADLLLE